MKSLKFPTAHTVLFIIAALVALLTWVLPSGEYDRLSYSEEANEFLRTGKSEGKFPASQETLDEFGIKIPLENFTSGSIWKPIGIPGTYHKTVSKPQGFLAFFQAPLKGIIESIDIILFVLILGGMIGVVHSTHAFDSGVASLSNLLKGKEFWLIIIVTCLMAAGGTTFGLSEETIAFYPILVPVFLAAGYDAIVALSCIFIGSSIGGLGGTTNPFSVIIASDAAGINWLLGVNGRLIMLISGTLICLWYILRYAKRVKGNPELSVIYDQKEEIEAAFLNKKGREIKHLTLKQKIILVIFTSCFVLMIYGVSSLDWWFLEMTTIFFVGAVLIGIVGQVGEKKFVRAFVSGANDLLSVALIIGIARGITVLMENGQVSDTLLDAGSGLVSDMPKGVFINMLYFVYMGLSLFIPSSSGMAVLTMPIFAPLADVVGIGREMIVNTYIYGQGLLAFINPTSMILASLTMINVGFNKWLKFVWPLVLILALLSMLFLTAGVYLS
ncbi:YfcC family protein [uncultured Arcticibacterium sp.]|uniref:YfcC family protein n=1 Tax=uncultured Arcticibacterium sp. TaxID=2173042 RepID=UPI0030F6AE1C